MAIESDHLNSLQNCTRASHKKCTVGYTYRRADGTCNNLRTSWWGSASSPYKRLRPQAYADSLEKPRKFSKLGRPLKSARLIAMTMHSCQDEYGSITHFVPFFGQYVMYDVVIRIRIQHMERAKRRKVIKKNTKSTISIITRTKRSTTR